MTFSEKLGYKVGTLFKSFKNWQISLWIKIFLIVATISPMLFLIGYFSNTIFSLIGYIFAIGLAIKYDIQCPTSNNSNPESSNYDEGLRDGHSGYGHYINNYRVE